MNKCSICFSRACRQMLVGPVIKTLWPALTQLPKPSSLPRVIDAAARTGIDGCLPLFQMRILKSTVRAWILFGVGISDEPLLASAVNFASSGLGAEKTLGQQLHCVDCTNRRGSA